jgi:hypothetical protein
MEIQHKCDWFLNPLSGLAIPKKAQNALKISATVALQLSLSTAIQRTLELF